MSILLFLSLMACDRKDEGAPYYNVGGFQVAFSTSLDELRTDPDAVVTIVQSDDPEHVLWSSPPGQAFVGAAAVDLSAEYGSGSFLITEDVEDLCSAQSVEGAEKVGDDLVLTGELDDCDLQWTLTLSEVSPQRLGLQLEVEGGSEYNRVSLASDSDKLDHIVGFGAQYSGLDMQRQTLPIWCQEQGIGRGLQPLTDLISGQEGDPSGRWYSTYTCAPVYYTDGPTGFYLENTGYVTFDMSERDRVLASASGTSLTGGVLAGATVEEMVRAYTEFSGRMDALPSWTQTGAVVRASGGSGSVRAALAELLAEGAPVSALWIEDWCGTRQTSLGDRMWWTWEPDPTLYPDWAALLAELNAAGIKPLLYFNPYLTDASEKEGLTRDLYAEALAAGYLVLDGEGEVYTMDQGGFDAAFVDLTNPDAVSWLSAIQAEQVALGAAGWMADFGEGLPVDVTLASGEDGWEVHNTWPQRWAELNAATAASTGADLLTWHRSGAATTPGVARLFWLGDQTVTWDAYDGLATVVPALLSSGLSGFSLQHIDAGGYLSVSLLDIVRSESLLERWTELATFTALLRTHSTNEPEENVQYNSNPETLAHFQRMATIYAALAPARADLMVEAQVYGLPMIRPMFLGWPDESAAWDLTQQFMLGEHLLVAPVVEEGETSVDVWLPPGHWVHLWSRETLGDVDKGTWARVDAPIGEPAVFWPLDDEVGQRLLEALDAAGVTAL